jgi:hypothetical protein
MIEQASASTRLSDQQRAQLIARLRQGHAPRAVIEIPPRSATIQEIPASLAQQQLWVFDRSQPTAAATYNIPFAVHLQGKLDADALRQALCALVGRHESLPGAGDRPGRGAGTADALLRGRRRMALLR